ncbi:MAG: spondin domain-containing protein [Albidovulum sp.]
MKHGYLTAGAAVAAIALSAGALSAKTVTITITNHQQSGGLYLTPLLTAFHDGSFDAFNSGASANAGVELLAEEGDPSGIINANPGVKTAVITSPGGFAGAPVIDPGETATLTIQLDPATERYFSFLSMVIPSNDNFIGNNNPLAYQLFDAAGQFTNIGPINILGGNVWDAGTEVNNGVGAAFNTAGGTGTDEGGVITLQSDLSFLLGSTTPAGTSVSSVPGARALFATIQIAAIPLPAALPIFLGGLGMLGFAAKRRRRNA